MVQQGVLSIPHILQVPSDAHTEFGPQAVPVGQHFWPVLPHIWQVPSVIQMPPGVDGQAIAPEQHGWNMPPQL